jgi:hypothetical protein
MTGSIVAAALGTGCWWYARQTIGMFADQAGAHRALRLNQGRRASDRLAVADGGLDQIDIDGLPLDEPNERRAVA